MSRERILVVEDDEDIMELISYNLEKEKYQVVQAASGEKALKKIAEKAPALILLDLMLPEIDGLDLCKKIKQNDETRSIPVIMVTAKGEEADVVAGLELGADDYVTKPFRPKELIARVRAVLRRASAPVATKIMDVIKVHNIEINTGKREVKVGGKLAELSYTEFEVLRVLAQKPGWVFTRYQIVDAIRGDSYPVTDRSVDVQVVGLRKKLGKSSRYVETVRGIGYRMSEGGEQ